MTNIASSAAFWVVMLFMTVFLSAVSQLMLKSSALEKHKSWIFEYLNAKVIAAYVLYFGCVCIDLLALKIVPASYIPIIETSSYVFVTILSAVVFKEKVSLKQFFAMLLVVCGIFIYVV